MNNATKLPKIFTPYLLKCILNFEHCRIDKNIYLNDLCFHRFINDTVLNILTLNDIKEIKDNIKSENIFFESFYFIYELNKLSDKIPNRNVKPFNFILDYLHINDLLDHYYVIDTYLELY